MNRKKKKLVVLSGAGMSAESGIATFRGGDGLWRGHRVEDVASPQAWRRQPETVLDFYNERRKVVVSAQPHRGHAILAELQDDFDVQIVTQNVDDLHERAGSQSVLHLHGEIRKARSTANPSLVYLIDGWQLNLGDQCELGSQLRPHIVWFGEPVTQIQQAATLCANADLFVVVGTSLVVYPAAGLIDFVKPDVRKWVIDPKLPPFPDIPLVTSIEATASAGLEKLADELRHLHADCP